MARKKLTEISKIRAEVRDMSGPELWDVAMRPMPNPETNWPEAYRHISAQSEIKRRYSLFTSSGER